MYTRKILDSELAFLIHHAPSIRALARQVKALPPAEKLKVVRALNRAKVSDPIQLMIFLQAAKSA